MKKINIFSKYLWKRYFYIRIYKEILLHTIEKLTKKPLMHFDAEYEKNIMISYAQIINTNQFRWDIS